MDLSKPPPNHPDNRPAPEAGEVEVTIRDHSNEWPPTADEAAQVPTLAAAHWDDRLWRRGPF